MMIKTFVRRCAMVLLIFCSAIHYSQGQTVEEIEIAKAAAKSLGYSETEINQMLKSKEDGRKSNNKVTVAPQLSRVDTAVTGLDLYNSTRIVQERAKPSTIYGHDIFRSPDLNFVPSYNIPTPTDYKLAAGDEIIIDIWGAVFNNQSFVISPEGSVTVPDIGPVYLNGLTIEKGQMLLKNRLSKIYSGIGGSNPNTWMRLTLGRIRSFSVNVVGDVYRPGTYTLPSLSTVFSALYLAGGPTEIGSVRKVNIYRNNKLYKTFDTYDFIINGDFSSNIRLEDNDLIKVDSYNNLVTIRGKVKREMVYEMKDGEKVSDLLKYAGGFAKDAYNQRVHIVRVKGEQSESFDVNSGEFGEFELKNGDIVTVPSNLDENKNGVSIEGAVVYPGTFAISESLMTLKQLIEAAGGIKAETYTQRGYIERFNEKREPVFVNFNVADVISSKEDVLLKSDDKVRLFSNKEFEISSLVYTFGELNKPGYIEYKPGMTLGDVILLSGGFTIGASQSNIDIARRNANDGGGIKSDTISTIFNFNLLENPEAIEFELIPYDEIYVRRAPNYKKQQIVIVEGEVVFPGKYALEKNVVRITDIVFKAGGFNPDAYTKGCILERKLTDEEYERALVATEYSIKKAGDTTTFAEMDIKRTFKIGIDMDAAMDQPGSGADVIIRDGDIIRVPKMNNTVKISGGVLYENVVAYNPSYSVSDYIEQAGGYIKKAKRGSTYIVYMNGTLATKRSRGGLKIEPGCEIVVPIKEVDDSRKLSMSEILSLSTSTVSIATMVLSLVRILSN